MNLKAPALLLAALSLATSLLAQGAQLFSWDFSQAYAVGTSVEAPESASGPAIRFLDGAFLAKDPDEQNRQVLVLNGAQTDWGRSSRNIDPLDAIQLRLRFKPDLQGSPLQTLVSVCGAYELRYNRGRERLEFIVHLPDKKFRMATADVSAGIWNQAVATYRDGRLLLVVGMSRGENTLPDDLRPAPINTSVRIGLVGERPFTGSLSEFTISTP